MAYLISDSSDLTLCCSCCMLFCSSACYQLSMRMLIDNPFSRVLVTIQLLIRNLFPTSFRYVQQYASTEDKRISSKKTAKTLFLSGTRGETLKYGDGRLLWYHPDKQSERKRLWERVQEAKRPRRPCMRVGNLWVRSLRPHELVRTSLRNQTVRHNISSVKSRQDGWRRRCWVPHRVVWLSSWERWCGGSSTWKSSLWCGGISTCKSSLVLSGWSDSTWVFLPLLCFLRDSSVMWVKQVPWTQLERE
jgi:hypothetical protein